jgi:hypothetical protein
MSKLNGWTFSEKEKPSTSKANSADISTHIAEFLKSGGEIEKCKSECDHMSSRQVNHNQSLAG